mmetsp:Transcript_29657/g.27112  ORF Transcript_29657/g.27112 Transcript_29657/m.27112 type:complete len:226 (-) Transcript_29657:1273-1950(-)
MLHNIVPILTLAALKAVLHQLIDHRLSLILSRVLKNSLNNSASIGMESKIIDLFSNNLNNKHKFIRLDGLKAFLNDVISILVLNKSKDISLKLTQNLILNVALKLELLQSSLDDSATISMATQINDSSLGAFKDLKLLLVSTMFKDLLDHVVSENILHQRNSLRLNLLEDTVLLIIISFFKMKLNQSGTILVLATLNQMTQNIFNIHFLILILVLEVLLSSLTHI